MTASVGTVEPGYMVVFVPVDGEPFVSFGSAEQPLSATTARHFADHNNQVLHQAAEDGRYEVREVEPAAVPVVAAVPEPAAVPVVAAVPEPEGMTVGDLLHAITGAVRAVSGAALDAGLTTDVPQAERLALAELAARDRLLECVFELARRADRAR